MVKTIIGTFLIAFGGLVFALNNDVIKLKSDYSYISKGLDEIKSDIKDIKQLLRGQ